MGARNLALINISVIVVRLSKASKVVLLGSGTVASETGMPHKSGQRLK
jgi:hypothetical protein